MSEHEWNTSDIRVLSPVYTTLNFWYGTDKIGTRTTFWVLGLPNPELAFITICGPKRMLLLVGSLLWDNPKRK